MTTRTDSHWSRMLGDAAKNSVEKCIRTQYFPEVWYLVEAWFQSPTKARSALELGYGLGLVGPALARTGWDVTCCDPSFEALTQLKQRFAAVHVRARFEQSEPEYLPFPNQSFDRVVCLHALEIAASPVQVLHEVARVLVPGGRAIVATFNSHSPWGLTSLIRSIRSDKLPRPIRPLGRSDFDTFLKASRLEVDSIKERARFLPIASKFGKLHLPVAGSFVALLEKPRRDKPAGKMPRPPGDGPKSKDLDDEKRESAAPDRQDV